MQYANYKLHSIETPVDVDRYEDLLKRSRYDREETEFLIHGFRHGFDIGYRGPEQRWDTAPNIPFSVGNKYILWNKIMKEVKLGRVAGPYRRIPYSRGYMQSPIGLVPKDGNKTRMIFHLSYDYPNGNRSLNYWTPKDWCSVQYNDIDHAVQNCLYLLNRTGKHRIIYYSRSDLSSAFRALPNPPDQRRFLLFKAENPLTGEICFFAEKNIPFGAGISCSHFQRFSNSLRHIVEEQLRQHYVITNYLDDYLFIAISEPEANHMVRTFIQICEHIRFPVAMEKTEWGSSMVVFLGILLDGKRKCLAIPDDKRQVAFNLVRKVQTEKESDSERTTKSVWIFEFLT